MPHVSSPALRSLRSVRSVGLLVVGVAVTAALLVAASPPATSTWAPAAPAAARLP